jgi:hypothetical protein
LNCIGGKSTTRTLRLAGKNAHLVTYGAMAKEPLTFPPSAFIFDNLGRRACQVCGYGQGAYHILRYIWSYAPRTEQVKEPNHEIVKIDGKLSDEEATSIVRGAMNRLASGSCGKKILLQVDPVQS